MSLTRILLLLTLSALLLSPSLEDDEALFGDFLDGPSEKKDDAAAVDHHLENKTEIRKLKNDEMQEDEKKKGLHRNEERRIRKKPASFKKMVRKCGGSKQVTSAINGDHKKGCFSWAREDGDDSGLLAFTEADYHEPTHHPPLNN